MLVLLALAPFVVVVGVACVREPIRVGLPLYAAVVPIGGDYNLGGSRFLSASSVLGLLVAVGLVLRLFLRRGATRQLGASVPVWVLFLAVAGATAIWSIRPGVSLRGLAVLASLVVVYLVVSLTAVDRHDVRRVENGLLIGSVLVVGYGLYQLVLLNGFVADTPGAGVVAGGRFGNGLLGPNIQAVALLMPMVIALKRAFDKHDPGRTGLNLLVAGLMLAGILMTGSRTGSLGAGIVLVAMLLVGPRSARPGLAAALVAGLLLGGLVWVFHPLGIAERTFATATASSGRLDIWEVGLSACRDYCAVGAGWGTFPDVYERTQASVPGAQVLSGAQGSYQPHNIWLLALIETGFVGFVLLTVGLASALVAALRLSREYRTTAVGMLVGLVFGVFFLSSMEFKIFWLVLMMVSLYRNAMENDMDHAGSQRVGSYPSARTSQ